MSSPDSPSTAPLIYLDNAATSFPKPTEVPQAVNRWLTAVGGSPGRSGHRLSTLSSRAVFEARERLATLLGVSSSRQIVFTKNATEALNMAFFGLLDPGDRVVTSSLEHNSVMRPLRHLAEQGIIDLVVVPTDSSGHLDPRDVAEALSSPTRLLAVTHASNVTGSVLPVEELGFLCRSAGTLFLVDAAQTAGALPIEAEKWGIDLLAFTGHKSLFGPPGTGGLCLGSGVTVRPLTLGGTGSNSEEEQQPSFLPDRLEAGTVNAAGIAGLLAGVEFILATGVEEIRRREERLTARLLAGLGTIPGVLVRGPARADERVAVVSITVDRLAPSEVGFLLDEGFGIMTRVGLHCAPAAHRAIGTFPAGTVRFSPGFFTTDEEIDATVEAVTEIARRAGDR